MKITPTEIPEVLLIEPDVFSDARGWFFESYSALRYGEQGLTATFVQDNASRSPRNVLRGLHMQSPPSSQGKLVSAMVGDWTAEQSAAADAGGTATATTITSAADRAKESFRSMG